MSQEMHVVLAPAGTGGGRRSPGRARRGPGPGSSRSGRLPASGPREGPRSSRARRRRRAASSSRRSVSRSGDRIERVLGELAVGAPLLQVRLHRLPVARRLAAVRAGELDAAWVRAVPSAPGLELLPLWDDPLYVALPEGHPLAAERVLRLEQLAGLPVRLAPWESNPPFRELVTGALRAAGTGPVLGPPFTDLRATLTAIGTDRAPSWTPFYEVHGLPSVPRVAVRPLAGLAVTTSLAVRPDPPGPALRHLLRSLRAVERETSQHPCV
ncbi:LysR family substrate-binding domain-containing protein [Streptomyces sp. NPDC058548]|uniref:LysR family substrate-binding domain-containing protein n=1 Tax=Streptomyces sp. NPDC058548 TaxID=3346545 RepID=UPI003647623F